jgi:hypothetical protein
VPVESSESWLLSAASASRQPDFPAERDQIFVVGEPASAHRALGRKRRDLALSSGWDDARLASGEAG